MPLEGEFAPEEAREWKAKIVRQKCTEAQQEAGAHPEALDEALFAQRPVGRRVVGFRRRTLVTRFGEVCLPRRLYRDERGKYRWLLDEYLRLPAHQAATPDMRAICTAMGFAMSYRKATKVLTRCLAGVLSTSTCWRLLQPTGQAAARADAAAVEAVFKRGKPVPEAGERAAERLYMERMGSMSACSGSRRPTWSSAAPLPMRAGSVYRPSGRRIGRGASESIVMSGRGCLFGKGPAWPGHGNGTSAVPGK
jgi:hypothetical protein